MHEMSLLRNVLDIALDACKGQDVKRITAVHVSIGVMRDMPEQFITRYFQYCARGTLAENAEVVVTRVPFTVRCQECGDVFTFDVHDSEQWVCPQCGARQRYCLNTGNELAVTSIEVEPGEGALGAVA